MPSTKGSACFKKKDEKGVPTNSWLPCRLTADMKLKHCALLFAILSTLGLKRKVNKNNQN